MNMVVQTSQEESSAEQIRQWVTFRLGSQDHAMPVDAVQEVLRVPEIARVPGAPRFILGVMNLRGNIVAVVDGRARFDMPSAQVSEQQRILVVRAQEYAMGMLVDRVIDVVELRTSDIEPMSTVNTQQPDSPIFGVAYQQEGFLVLVDTTALLGGE